MFGSWEENLGNRVFWKRVFEAAQGDYILTIENAAGDNAPGVHLVDSVGLQVGIPAVPFSVSDPGIDLAMGVVTGKTPVLKFGRNEDVDTATAPEDVTDAGGIYVLPTQARIHDLVSTDVADTAAGTGAQTVKVCGLVDWDTAETSEVVSLAGTVNAPTVNAYVILHRMEVISVGSGGTAAGTISATAQTDATVSAQIIPPHNRTLMAIFGIPSVQKFFVHQWYANINKGTGTTSSADFDLYVMERADLGTAPFVVRSHLGLITAGSSHINHQFGTPEVVVGPAVVKVQVEQVSANNMDVSGGFDGVLVDN